MVGAYHIIRSQKVLRDWYGRVVGQHLFLGGENAFAKAFGLTC